MEEQIKLCDKLCEDFLKLAEEAKLHPALCVTALETAKTRLLVMPLEKKLRELTPSSQTTENRRR